MLVLTIVEQKDLIKKRMNWVVKSFFKKLQNYELKFIKSYKIINIIKTHTILKSILRNMLLIFLFLLLPL